MINDDIRKAAMDELKEIFESLNAPANNDIVSSCKEVFNLYKGLVDAGFTPEQAMQLVNNLLGVAMGCSFRKGND